MTDKIADEEEERKGENKSFLLNQPLTGLRYAGSRTAKSPALTRRLDVIAATCDDLRRFATPPYPVSASTYEAVNGWVGPSYAEVTRLGNMPGRSD